MSKRKLTRRQNWRIQKVQAEKAARMAKKADRLSTSEDLGDEEPGLVVSHFGTFVEVEVEPDGETAPEAEPEPAVQCHFRANVGAIVAGDRVVMRRGQSGYGVIETVLPRRSLLSRPDPRGNLKPVAANIDFLVLVITPEPAPSSLLIDRYLVAAELQQLEVRILLNKTDLITELNEVMLEELLNRYRDIGYPVWESSATTHHGLDELQQHLDQHTSVFVGQSGVGKSSLVNALLPGVNARVGELSESSRLGRHTTTNARLFHFPTGGSLIDSPGIREFGLWHLDPDKVIDGFPDFEPWRRQCKFRDCRHQQEPGCALRAAVERNAVHPQRLDNYFALVAALRGER
ncbi:MAG: small ribosomal subunit biogenesis GTPase RsgA [Pseudomonadota bacterium]|nr:small ribosomal subunit biogenesis GTPase RsgA [Pseudomonadota bacterium]